MWSLCGHCLPLRPMLILLSPAKTLHDPPPISSHWIPEPSQPFFQSEAQQWMTLLQGWDKSRLQRDMKLSPALAEKVNGWHQHWFEAKTSMAGWTFAGDAFKSLDFPTLTMEAQLRGQSQLRILHGLYGVLRPMDEMRKARHEMAQTWGGKEVEQSPAQFWSMRLGPYLSNEAETLKDGWLLNLASTEYSVPALRDLAPEVRVVECSFAEIKGERWNTVSSYTKTARGAMARYVLENNISSPDDLCTFQGLGYAHRPDRSTPNSVVFSRTSQS